MTDRLATSSRTFAVALACVLACVPMNAFGEKRTTDLGRGGAEAVTVEEAIAVALARSPDMSSSRKELDIARARLSAAKRLVKHNPQVGASLGHRDFDDGGSAVQPSAQLSVELEVAGQRGRRIEAARLEVARVEAEIADAERLLRARVREAFYRALHAGQRLTLAREAEALSRRLRDASTARFERGEAAKMEPNMAAIRHVRASGDLLAAQRAAAAALRTLETGMGREPRATLRLAGDLAAVDETGLAASAEARNPLEGDAAWVARALRQRPDVRAARAELERTGAERDLAARLAIPNPTVGAFYEEEAEDGARDRIAGAALTIPLPLFDRRQAERAEADGRSAQAQLAIQSLESRVRAEVEDALAAVRAASALVTVYRADALGRIDESMGFVETAYREGKIDLLERIVADNDLLEARAARVDALLDYQLALTELGKAMGGSLEPRDRAASEEEE